MRQRFDHLGELVHYQAITRGDAPALEFEDSQTSFSTLDRHCRQIAGGLQAAGLDRGARIAYLGKNSDFYFELLLGAAIAGIAVVPLNWRLAAAELEQILADAQIELLFAAPEFADIATELALWGDDLRRIIQMASGTDPQQHFTAWRDGAAAVAHDAVALSRDDVFLQLYTSGTTGKPKGVMLSHGSLLGALEIADQGGESWRQWTPDIRALVAMPVFHVSGTGWALGAFYGGGCSVILPEFSISGVEEAIGNRAVTHVMIVPAALQTLIDKWESGAADWGALTQIAYGASPMPPVLLDRCLKLLGCDFVQYYGMTETFGSFVALPPEDHVHPVGNRLASTGRIMSGNAMKIVDADGKVVPPMTVGEVCVRAAGIMAGYWRMPDATREAFDGDGWLRTGDAGFVDEDGYLFLRDRIKDMIISGGENIYPIEVENALLTHPTVSEVAVIGVPDERWGEAVKAVVVLKEGASVDANQLIAHTRTLIAGYKSPRSVDFVESLPRNTSGKILKRELRAPYWAAADSAIA